MVREGWQRYAVSEVCELIVDCVNKTAPVVEHRTPYRMVRTSHISNGRITLTDEKFVAKETYEKWTRRAKLEVGDVLLTREAPLGEVGYIHEPDTLFLGQRIMQYRANTEKLDPRFLLYSFLGSDLQAQFHAHGGTGSTVDHIRVPDCGKFKLWVPPLVEQRTITGVLGALDDKIELNRQTNATLEAMARALFQSWFVDFDPVRAKLDGRQPPGMDNAAAALFPSTFEAVAVGHVPAGWEVAPVGEVVSCVGGATPSTAEPRFWEGGIHHWTTPKDFSSLEAPVLIDTERRITDAGVSKISSGLLPAGTVLLSSRAPVGYLAITAIPVAINQGFIAMKCNARVSNFFILNWCQSNMAEIEGRATGTTFSEISKQNFRPILLVLPTKKIMTAFTDIVTPLYDRITANLRECVTLAALRDTLLPKLLNGELDLSQTAESFSV